MNKKQKNKTLICLTNPFKSNFDMLKKNEKFIKQKQMQVRMKIRIWKTRNREKKTNRRRRKEKWYETERARESAH